MAYGIQFHYGSNAGICGSAEFSVRKNGSIAGRYKVGFGPHDSFVCQFLDKKWAILKEGRGNDVIAFLLSDVFPNYKECHFDWTWHGFIIALDHWSEGQKVGYEDGKEYAYERLRRDKE